MNYLREYGIAFITFITIDLFWLGIFAKNIYKKHLGFIMSSNPNWLAAIGFYLLYIVGILFFVVNPAIEKGSWKYALFAGIFFGFITYATYDLTNLATLANWPIKITIIDLIWGSTICGTVSWVTYTVITKMKWML
ncbi:DUF2177 family protein [Clostridium lacusfryxellense]|uniref:DUF2177 family protein n=1 Tax=Clostridium lacusfryxellense TaxID=205328 RepID=UPI001C0D9B4D|nr:DUF2177 family protein [Clostridium lacusfryxellense]MBU3110157.1 DUF2177 family protein [Clostridium lacusfryxellense]